MKKIFILLLSVLVACPAFAVFDKDDLSGTLSSLRIELENEISRCPANEQTMNETEREQHIQLIRILKKCNELSLMLYSQNQDFTFDLTYALKEVTVEYQNFNKHRLPFDDIVAHLDLEIERYARLVESLRRLPPQLEKVEDLPDSLAYHNDSLKVFAPVRNSPVPGYMLDSLRAEGRRSAFFLDERGQEDRDSCLMYATMLLKMYSEAKDRVIEDSEHYDNANMRLKESYDYAQERYKLLQKNIFVNGQEDYFTVIRHFPAYFGVAVRDAGLKYGRDRSSFDEKSFKDWRGPMVLNFFLMMLAFLVIATVISHVVVKLLSRCVKSFRTEEFKEKAWLFTLLCGIVVFALANGIGMAVTGSNFFRLANGQLEILSWLLSAIVASVYIRYEGDELKKSLRLFLPLALMGIVVIAFRVIFIPNSVMNLILSPILLGFFIWQLCATVRNNDDALLVDRSIAWVSVVVFGISTVMSWIGYVLLGVQVLIWWLFQVSAIETVMVLYRLLKRYNDAHLASKRAEFVSKAPNAGRPMVKGDFLSITWFYDLLEIAVIPIIAVLSFPVTVYLALNVFDLTDVYHFMMTTTFFDLFDANGNEMLKVSLQMIILATSMFFLFKYINYAAKSVYRNVRYRNLMQSKGKSYIHTNEVNLTLANNVISILVWGTYVIITIILLKIPTGAVSIIAAGLATGLGLAMKDILNNFIYGIQLMSGRLRVGDWMECDGVRGKVTAISYQSTQMETTDGAVMSFLNTALFNKNFKNLTRNNDYEFVKIVVGVAYGTDVEKARILLSEAVAPLQTKDKFNRNIVDVEKGVTVVFDEFGDSSVNIAVKQYVLVPERAGYIAAAKEAIYNKLNGNGIEIPFPQRDIHIITG